MNQIVSNRDNTLNQDLQKPIYDIGNESGGSGGSTGGGGSTTSTAITMSIYCNAIYENGDSAALPSVTFKLSYRHDNDIADYIETILNGPVKGYQYIKQIRTAKTNRDNNPIKATLYVNDVKIYENSELDGLKWGNSSYVLHITVPNKMNGIKLPSIYRPFYLQGAILFENDAPSNFYFGIANGITYHVQEDIDGKKEDRYYLGDATFELDSKVYNLGSNHLTENTGNNYKPVEGSNVLVISVEDFNEIVIDTSSSSNDNGFFVEGSRWFEINMQTSSVFNVNNTYLNLSYRYYAWQFSKGDVFDTSDGDKHINDTPLTRRSVYRQIKPIRISATQPGGEGCYYCLINYNISIESPLKYTIRKEGSTTYVYFETEEKTTDIKIGYTFDTETSNSGYVFEGFPNDFKGRLAITATGEYTEGENYNTFENIGRGWTIYNGNVSKNGWDDDPDVSKPFSFYMAMANTLDIKIYDDSGLYFVEPEPKSALSYRGGDEFYAIYTILKRENGSSGGGTTNSEENNDEDNPYTEDYGDRLYRNTDEFFGQTFLNGKIQVLEKDEMFALNRSHSLSMTVSEGAPNGYSNNIPIKTINTYLNDIRAYENIVFSEEKMLSYKETYTDESGNERSELYCAFRCDVTGKTDSSTRYYVVSDVTLANFIKPAIRNITPLNYSNNGGWNSIHTMTSSDEKKLSDFELVEVYSYDSTSESKMFKMPQKYNEWKGTFNTTSYKIIAVHDSFTELNGNIFAPNTEYADEINAPYSVVVPHTSYISFVKIY